MKFFSVFFRYRGTEKMDSVIKELTEAMPPSQNFWARTAPDCKDAVPAVSTA